MLKIQSFFFFSPLFSLHYQGKGAKSVLLFTNSWARRDGYVSLALKQIPTFWSVCLSFAGIFSKWADRETVYLSPPPFFFGFTWKLITKILSLVPVSHCKIEQLMTKEVGLEVDSNILQCLLLRFARSHNKTFKSKHSPIFFSSKL